MCLIDWRLMRQISDLPNPGWNVHLPMSATMLVCLTLSFDCSRITQRSTTCGRICLTRSTDIASFGFSTNTPLLIFASDLHLNEYNAKIQQPIFPNHGRYKRNGFGRCGDCARFRRTHLPQSPEGWIEIHPSNIGRAYGFL